jgi:hypothetical protein
MLVILETPVGTASRMAESDSRTSSRFYNPYALSLVVRQSLFSADQADSTSLIVQFNFIRILDIFNNRALLIRQISYGY